MKIIGLDELVFGVDDLTAAAQFLADYGLDESAAAPPCGRRFEALDGTGIRIAEETDGRLPPALPTGSRLRKTVLGVADAQTVQDIAAELGKDREVRHLPDGSIEALDDSGFLLGFQVSVRRPLELLGELSNSPGAPLQRRPNHLGVSGGDARIRARSLSHLVYFVPDLARAQAFYVERLGFRVVDAFANVGPFIRPAGTQDHHTHFLIGAPAHMQGVEHFTFHFGGPSELMANGTRFQNKGYQPFWGPGRHLLGSNWFWYFNSPFACHVEMDADMDQHDENWVPRVLPLGADHSQAFLFRSRHKWLPGQETPAAGDYA
jgi:catechol 2,3-dioxygenase-like lactoylglutathione lyase family enzyme